MGRLSTLLKTAQDPMMAGGAPMDPSMMGGAMPAGGMPMDPSVMGGAMPAGMPMDPAMMGGAMPAGAMPMDPAMMAGGMPAGGGMPIDPMALQALMSPAAAAPTEPSIDQDLLNKSLQVANSAIDLAKAQTAKVEDMSTQLATVLQSSGALSGLGPEDLQDMAAAQDASAPMTI